MKEFILTIGTMFVFITAICVGSVSLMKYKNSTKSSVGFWKGVLIIVGYSVFSILITIPVAIAEWAVNTTLNFDE